MEIIAPILQSIGTALLIIPVVRAWPLYMVIIRSRKYRYEEQEMQILVENWRNSLSQQATRLDVADYILVLLGMTLGLTSLIIQITR